MYTCVAIFFYLMYFPSVFHTMYLRYTHTLTQLTRWKLHFALWFLMRDFLCIFCVAYAVHCMKEVVRVTHCTFILSQCWSMGSGRSVRSFYGSLHIFNQKLILPLWSHLNIHGQIHICMCIALHCSVHMDNGYRGCFDSIWKIMCYRASRKISNLKLKQQKILTHTHSLSYARHKEYYTC